MLMNKVQNLGLMAVEEDTNVVFKQQITDILGLI